MFAEDNNSISFEQLQYAFEPVKGWLDLQNLNSRISRLFNARLLRDSQRKDRLNVHRVILMGLVQCEGSPDLKARVLYDVLQDDL